jgi:hypothetical protein
VSAAVTRWVEATRAAQGLPPRVTDAQVLDEVAAIVGAAREGGDGLARAS